MAVDQNALRLFECLTDMAVSDVDDLFRIRDGERESESGLEVTCLKGLWSAKREFEWSDLRATEACLVSINPIAPLVETDILPLSNSRTRWYKTAIGGVWNCVMLVAEAVFRRGTEFQPPEGEKVAQEAWITENASGLMERFCRYNFDRDAWDVLKLRVERELILLQKDREKSSAGTVQTGSVSQERLPEPEVRKTEIHRDFNHLNLIVDEASMTLGRKGYEKTINLKELPRLWETFLVFWKAGKQDASDDEWTLALDGENESQNKRDHRRRLKENLYPIGVSIPHGGRRLIELPIE